MLLRDNPKYSKQLKKYAENCSDISLKQIPVAFFGASLPKLEIVNELLKQGIVIDAILDNNPALDGTSYQDIEIMLPQKYSRLDAPVIMGVNQAPIELYRQLKSLGFSKIFPYLAFIQNDSEILNNLPQSLNFILEGFQCWSKNGIVLDSIDFVVTEKCSLKCKDCSNLMQYFKKPKDSDLEELMCSFDKLYYSVDYILELRILGGEPLLYKNLSYYIKQLSNYKNVGSIMIFTNATIPFSSELIDSMKDPRIVVILSDYGHQRQIIPEIIDELNNKGIKYDVQKHDFWQNCSEIKKNNRSDEENVRLMQSCCISHTSVIKNGKLWRCPFAGSLAALNVLSNELNEYIELYNSPLSNLELRRQIEKFLELPSIKVCDYCNGRPRYSTEIIPAAIQISKPIELSL